MSLYRKLSRQPKQFLSLAGNEFTSMRKNFCRSLPKPTADLSESAKRKWLAHSKKESAALAAEQSLPIRSKTVC